MRIWTFWNSDILPDIIRGCIDTWEGRGYTITVLNPKNLSDYIHGVDILSLPYADTPQRLSDFVRLHVLYEHGGFWLDASVIMIDGIDSFTAYNKPFVGYKIDTFTTNARNPVIENWFFGCVPRCTFVGLWKDEFMRINDCVSCVTYVENMKFHGIDKQNIPHLLPYYLTMHMAAQSVLQRQGLTDTMHLSIAEHGPLKYLAEHHWNTKNAVAAIPFTTGVPFIKLRGSERDALAATEWKSMMKRVAKRHVTPVDK